MSTNIPSGSFSLFPNTGRPPSRTQGPQPGAASPEQPATVLFPAPPQQAIGEAVTAEVRIEWPPAVTGVAPAAPVTVAPAVTTAPEPPAVRSSSVRSRSSIAKVRLSMYDNDGPPEDDDPPPPMPTSSLITPSNLPPPPPFFPSQTASSSASPPSQNRPPALRSIFPQYNPDVPLDQQDYFPTQTSPTRIPRAVISRPLYSPVHQQEQQQQQAHEQQHQQQQQQHQSLDARANAPLYSVPAIAVTGPRSSTTSAAPVPAPAQAPEPTPTTQAPASVTGARPWHPAAGLSAPREAPTLPTPSTTEELRSFWKVANGWKAGPSEGRVYCLRLTCDSDAPVYRLSSASQQPFYRLRLDPTSVSAYVTLARHDPARAFKAEVKGGAEEAAAAEGGGDSSGRSSRNSFEGGGGTAATSAAAAAAAAKNARLDRSKNWQTALTTTLEAEMRRHRPDGGDGLVALLYPAAAAALALARPDDAAVVATAERECARLVWDDEDDGRGGHYFVVHPALALPFCVTIERSAAWSRTAYTLEHLESPQHLARLTRCDGTGTGFLEVDVGIAAKIDAAYLVDAVVAALVLVAHCDGRQAAQTELYAPPPVHFLTGGPGDGPGASPHASLVNLVLGGVGRSASRLSSSGGPAVTKKDKKKNKKAASKRKGLRQIETFDVDLESQTSIDLSGKMYEMGPMDNGGGGVGRKSRKKTKDKDKLPGCLRLVAVLFKCCFWCVSLVVRALLAVVSGLFRCLTHEKL